jgi:hypothetical protein
LDDCVILKAHVAEGKEYEKGSLVVTFFDLLDYDTALESLSLLGLTPDTSQIAKDNFVSHHWLPVSVPAGSEFKWQCQLEASEGVKTTNLNLTFKLHQ